MHTLCVCVVCVCAHTHGGRKPILAVLVWNSDPHFETIVLLPLSRFPGAFTSGGDGGLRGRRVCRFLRDVTDHCMSPGAQ